MRLYPIYQVTGYQEAINYLSKSSRRYLSPEYLMPSVFYWKGREKELWNTYTSMISTVITILSEENLNSIPRRVKIHDILAAINLLNKYRLLDKQVIDRVSRQINIKPYRIKHSVYTVIPLIDREKLKRKFRNYGKLEYLTSKLYIRPAISVAILLHSGVERELAQYIIGYYIGYMIGDGTVEITIGKTVYKISSSKDLSWAIKMLIDKNLVSYRVDYWHGTNIYTIYGLFKFWLHIHQLVYGGTRDFLQGYLAGIIDSDGTSISRGRYEINQCVTRKHDLLLIKEIVDTIIYVARKLKMHTHTKIRKRVIKHPRNNKEIEQICYRIYLSGRDIIL